MKLPRFFNSLQFRIQAAVTLVFIGVAWFFALLVHESGRLLRNTQHLEESAQISDRMGAWASEMAMAARERTKYVTLGKEEYLTRFQESLIHADIIYQSILSVGLREELASTIKLTELQEIHQNYKHLLTTVTEKSKRIPRDRNELFKDYEVRLKDGLMEAQQILGTERREGLARFEQAMQSMKRRLVYTMIPILLILGVIVVVLNQKVFIPLLTLERAAEEVGRGNLGLQVRIHGQDEIGKLTQVFNQMSSQLKVKQDTEVKLEKLDTIAHIVRSVNHEINNPLMIISGNAEFLTMTLEHLEKPLRAKLDGIIHEVNRISDITKKLKEIREPVTENYTGEDDKMIDLTRASGYWRMDQVR